MTAYIIMGIIIAILAVVVLAQHFNLKDADKLVKTMEDEINSLNNTITDLKTDILMIRRKKAEEDIKCKIKNYNTIKSMIKNNKLSKMFVNKDLICYIYNELNKNKKSKALISMCMLFPKATLCAIYLKAIIRGV